MGEVHHADDAEHHRVADGDQAVDRAERDAVDELLDEDFHASAAPLPGLPSVSRRCRPRSIAERPRSSLNRRPRGGNGASADRSTAGWPAAACAAIGVTDGPELRNHHPRRRLRWRVFAAMALWEVLAPRRASAVGRAPRWPSNLGIVVDRRAAGAPSYPDGRGRRRRACGASAAGACSTSLRVAGLARGAARLSGCSISSIYAQHVAFHHVPVLWRLHRMHHADLDIDVTTGVRFHPIEILISMLIKIAIVLAARHSGGRGPDCSRSCSTPRRCSIIPTSTMPAWLDRIVRLLVVTPDMHRVHHSIVRRETDSNFGFNLPWWDRLFGTYRRAAGGRPCRHDDRDSDVPRPAGIAHRPTADASRSATIRRRSPGSRRRR